MVGFQSGYPGLLALLARSMHQQVQHSMQQCWPGQGTHAQLPL